MQLAPETIVFLEIVTYVSSHCVCLEGPGGPGPGGRGGPPPGYGSNMVFTLPRSTSRFSLDERENRGAFLTRCSLFQGPGAPGGRGGPPPGYGGAQAPYATGPPPGYSNSPASGPPPGYAGAPVGPPQGYGGPPAPYPGAPGGQGGGGQGPGGPPPYSPAPPGQGVYICWHAACWHVGCWLCILTSLVCNRACRM
jgi:hypothetical protein